jgi:uncharacterized protein (DUF433 family)
LKPLGAPVTLTAMAKTKDWRKLVVVDPQIQGGRPVIKGTRVPVYVLVSALGAGEPFDEVCHQYGVSKEALLAAMSYAAEVLSEERAVAVPRR